MASSNSPFPNKMSFDMRLEYHKSFAATWRKLAASASAKWQSAMYTGVREEFEKFIVRANERALRHLREADIVRRRGHR